MTRQRSDKTLADGGGALMREAKLNTLNLSADQLRHAVRFVASTATDAQDCALLLDALGLDPADGKWTEAAA